MLCMFTVQLQHFLKDLINNIKNEIIKYCHKQLKKKEIRQLQS